MSSLKNNRVALVYDRVNKWGGAERVLLALHALFPDAPLYTSVYNPETAQWAKDFTVIPSFLQRVPFAAKHHELIPFLMPLAFESFSFDQYDLIISVTSEAAKGIITKPSAKHICYCLTPTRYLWSGYEDYFGNRLFTILAKPASVYLRKWDTIAAQRPDAYIAISGEVQQRVKKYYQRDSTVVYPPLTLESSKFEIRNSKQMQNLKFKINEKDYFLVVARLVPYKRIDLAIRACNELGLSLKIIGTGSEFRRLRAMAGETIEFLGSLTDEELVAYYEQCLGLLFPGIEDFGLAAVEAQYFGKPVIAYRESGAGEIIVEGKTGVFFYPQTVNALKSVLSTFNAGQFKADDCQRQASKFSKEQFKKQFLDALESLI